jgi:4-alpha-glucanotransferase
LPADLHTRAHRQLVRNALATLGLDRIAFQIHDASFPARDFEEVGYGSPCSQGGRDFLAFVAALGFDTLQLGPQGATSDVDASPYDSTLFSRNPLAVALGPLAHDPRWEGLIGAERLAAVTAACPAGRSRVHYRFAFEEVQAALSSAYARFSAARTRGQPAAVELSNRLAAFARRHGDWLERDALYEPLCGEHGRPSWQEWRAPDGTPDPDQRLWDPTPELAQPARSRRFELAVRHGTAVERYAFVQLLAHEQHARLRADAAGLGLELFADLQAGFSHRDVWAYRALFLRGYRLGAPPSRTNPEGQPWSFPVLDPERYGTADRPGPVARFLRARLEKLRSEYDGLRIDHPHGWVCPWVYRSDVPDPFEAVRGGARLFASPDLPDHPRLRAFSRVRPEQLDRSRPRHDDRWVRELDDRQVERYGELFGEFLAGPGPRPICEVLSTLPHPLARVMERAGLGRLRIAQKADPDRPDDVYRTENAQPADWVMLGNHDTPSIWEVAESWWRSGEIRRRAADLATRLAPEQGREAAARHFGSDPGALVHAMAADLLAGRARHAMVFFPDLLGLPDRYNVPGTVSEANWTLRVPHDYEAGYLARLSRNRALNLPRVLALALRAPGRSGSASREMLAALADTADQLALAGARAALR